MTMNSNADDLYQKGLGIWMSCTTEKHDLVQWSRINRERLLESFAYLEQANILERGTDPYLLAHLARLSFDLLDDKGATRFARQALAVDAHIFDAQYVLFLIAYNVYLDKKESRSGFGGLVGIALSLKKMKDVGDAKNNLEEIAQQLVDTAVTCLRKRDQSSENRLLIADILINSAGMLHEIGLNTYGMYQTVVNEFTMLLQYCPPDTRDMYFKRVALAKGQLRFKQL
jgi:hypothetical protein